MRTYFYALAIIYSFSLFGACPAMRKSSYKSRSYASPAKYATPAQVTDVYDQKIINFQ